jgi:hypothetical protein
MELSCEHFIARGNKVWVVDLLSHHSGGLDAEKEYDQR